VFRVETPFKKFESNKSLHLKEYQPKMGSLWDAAEIKEKT
jgi:hypothetical protein